MEPTNKCSIHTITDENIRACASKLQLGKTVIFPTETVYGIGACALNPEAISSIYKYKKRPKNNPLIIHVLDWTGAKIYTDLNASDEAIVYKLIDIFWPGPLTIIVKKSVYVSSVISANTEWVSLRSPANETARKLLEYSMVPIVAPSANISGKITSTYKDHLVDYFKNTDVSILADDKPSKIGIESTIIKIDNVTVSVVRPGIITLNDIKEAMKDYAGPINYKVCDVYGQAEHPGSSISHYSTNKNTILFNLVEGSIDLSTTTDEVKHSMIKSTQYYLGQSACIDFNCRNFDIRDKFGAYVDLSDTGDIHEAIFNLYNVLHQLNNTDVANILIFDCWNGKDGLYKTIYDRVYRCANGKHMCIPKECV